MMKLAQGLVSKCVEGPFLEVLYEETGYHRRL
jgi:hypothetical protein